MARANVREQLIRAGLETLHRDGFNASGVQDITQAAGVPKGSFYNHFESKEAFGAEVLARYWQERVGARLRILSDESIPPIERLRRYFDLVAEVLASNEYARGCLIGNFGAELAEQSRLVRDRLSAVFAGWTRAIENCIREAQRAGEVRADRDPHLLASFLINAWEGAVLRSKVERDATALDQFRRVVFSILLT